MKALAPQRDPAAVGAALEALGRRVSRRWTLMEVCGGQTHGLLASGLDVLLAESVELLHGPGCPVCVTPIRTIDRARALALEPGVVLCSFGDMLRVPGSDGDLIAARARGGDVRVVYSPLDAARIAEREPQRQVVFLAVGFETTVPGVAAALRWARERGLRGFSVLCAHVRVPPALEAIASDPDSRVDAFLAAGHVCTVTGISEYEPLARRHGLPIVVTGFEPLDLVRGVSAAVEQLERGEARVEIEYRRAVRPEGNPVARALVHEVFEIADRPWRGLGVVPAGGFALREAWAELDAERRFSLSVAEAAEPAECRAGQVLRGVLRPPECPAFGARCTPEHPLGAPMVSAEGACAAYYRFRAAGGAVEPPGAAAERA